MSLRSLPLGVALFALPLVLGGCSSTSPGDTAAEAGAAAALGHVHDLALNPGDGLVYAATHLGLYSLGRGEPAPVGESRQDTMGFTVQGPDTFLASGHPGPGQEGPGNLGLLRSTDAGGSWAEVSLGGVSDFHALTAVGDRIYGLDSSTGAVRRSDDGGSTWVEGAAIAARDLDAHPVDPDRVVATTAEGLMASDDGGATFTVGDGQPPEPLVVIDHLPAATGGAVVGLDAAGVVWRSEPTGWVSSGPGNGTPAAFTAVDEDTYLAAFDGTVLLKSEDRGESWQPIPDGVS
ncbi:hypothetical protein EDD32_2752 [Georgenia muralis]|uniref:BNR/Asp-box repeat protein n=1 Tax=Georgenia muralis TaxID=154117 RepID=A0A3N4Z8L0_9MICO|nr:hypothetical protein EDD32_2752 [Georgenia muralis]